MKNTIKAPLRQRTHRLLVQQIDPSAQIMVDEEGKQFVKTEWVEKEEINLGSLKHPNEKVLYIKLEPIRYEKDENKKVNNPFDAFKEMFE